MLCLYSLVWYKKYVRCIELYVDYIRNHYTYMYEY